jgi:hypothetical protein
MNSRGEARHNGLGKKTGYLIGRINSLPSTLGLLTIRETG